MSQTMTFEQAVMKVSSMTNNEFAMSLWRQYSRYGRLSPKQEAWVFKLANPPAPTVVQVSVGLMPIVELFKKALETLAKPKLTFRWADKDFRLSISRDGSAIHIADPVYGGAYYGKILMASGELIAGRNMCDPVVDFLTDFAADPVGKAAAYGHKTGYCCFCHKGLDNPASTEVGYGPVCAKRWGLPHKYATAKRKPAMA